MRYRVVVGNIGTVYEGDSGLDAMYAYDQYVANSRAGVGRGANEPVTLFANDQIDRDYNPDEYPTYLIVCKDDDDGLYVLATRRTFTLVEAQTYMATISPSRKPMLIGCLNTFKIVK